MLKNLVYSAALCTTLFAQASGADDYVEVQKNRHRGEKIVIIDTGSESNTSTRDMQKRLYRLEKAVRQLQERVFELELENDGLKDDKVKKTTCYLKTTKGVFSSTQKSMTLARAEAMQKCSEVVKFGFECDEDKVKCGE